MLVQGIPEAIAASSAVKVYVVNVMTQPGETDGYTAADHVQAVIDHGGRRIVDWVLVNSKRPTSSTLARYQEEGAEPVLANRQQLEHFGIRIKEKPLLSVNDMARHDPGKLAEAVLKLLPNLEVTFMKNTFSLKVKDELSRLEPGNSCCLRSELLGFLRAGAVLEVGQSGIQVIATTESPSVVRRAFMLLKRTSSLKVKISCEPRRIHNHNLYAVRLFMQPGLKEFLKRLGYLRSDTDLEKR